MVLILLIPWVLTGCTPTEVPTPTPEEAWELTPQEKEYLIKMRRYASFAAIVRARGISSGEADIILLELEYITPPPSLKDAHQKVMEGYRFIKEGRQILEKHPRGEEKAEGYFLIDWGIRYLFEFIDDVNLFLESHRR